MTPRITKVPDVGKFQGRKDFTMDELMRKSMKVNGTNYSDEESLYGVSSKGDFALMQRDIRSAGNQLSSARFRNS